MLFFLHTAIAETEKEYSYDNWKTARDKEYNREGNVLRQDCAYRNIGTVCGYNGTHLSPEG